MEIFLLFPCFLCHLWLLLPSFLFSRPKFCAHCFFLELTLILFSKYMFPTHPIRNKLSPHFSMKFSQLLYCLTVSQFFEFLALELDGTLNSFSCNCFTSVQITSQSGPKSFQVRNSFIQSHSISCDYLLFKGGNLKWRNFKY